MGRFKCVKCNCEYYSRRFLWEPDYEEEEDQEYVEKEFSRADPAESEPAGCLIKSALVKVEKNEEAPSKSWKSSEINDFLGEAPAGTAGKSSEASGSDQLKTAIHDWENAPSLHGSRYPIAEDADRSTTCSTSSDDELEDNPVSARRRASATGDMVRASGTVANIVGTAAPALHYFLSPFSVFGGVVGAASGAAQLHEGLSTESGVADPHLVTKGAVTATVGTTCCALGLGTIALPGLFAVALVLGATGVGVAFTVDATMDGLCDECRHGSKAKEHEVRVEKDTQEEDASNTQSSVDQHWSTAS
jgi:hypothetical protein